MTLSEQSAIRALLVSSLHTAKEAIGLMPADLPILQEEMAEAITGLYDALEKLNKLTVYEPGPASVMKKVQNA